jgi:hypothetical protein
MSNEKMNKIAKNQRILFVASIVGTLTMLAGTVGVVIGLV